MKIICEKEKLIKGINSVIRGVPTRTTLPILEGILIQTNDNEIKLTTYDLEIGIEYIMECEVKEQGSTVVNAIMFSEIIRKLPDTEIYITLNDKNLLEIECEGSLYKLATMNPDEFPELPKISIENSIEIEQNILKDPEIVIDRPHITYRVISRKPKNEYKPIIREEVIECDEYGEQRPGVIYGQFFDCIIQFNIFAGENRLANQVMEKFEELMIAHAGFFKQKGVSDFYFREQLTDSEYNNFRETLSVRNIRYYVQIEKLTVIFNRKVNDIKTVGDTVEVK